MKIHCACENNLRFFLAGLFALVSLNSNAVDLSGGLTVLGQSASDDRVENDVTASVDLGMTWQQPAGRWYLYIEGNTTPKDNGVATLLTESNADAGSALDEDRDGRLQVSELNYQFLLENDSMLTLGMLDASGYMDHSRISNDENTQFIGISFVNNPTIEFPDYALGLVHEVKAGNDQASFRFIVTSSNGLADNPNVSYGQLVNVDEPDKGLFVAARYGFETGRRLFGFGVWSHTAPHESLDGQDTNEKNFGTYIVSGWLWDQHALNMRLGAANPQVSESHLYTALSYRYKLKSWAFGSAVALIKLSDEANQLDRDDTVQSELFLRNELQPGLYLTASLQQLVNSGFDASNIVYDERIYVSTIRLSYVFE